MSEALASLRGVRRLRRAVCAAVCLLLACQPCWALLPTSKRVTDLVEKALTQLETLEPLTEEERKLGGKCVVGLAFYKAGRKDHPRVREAISACRATYKSGELERLDNYSLGLAIVFLAEVAHDSERGLLDSYLKQLQKNQKDTPSGKGGWGYRSKGQGDTSQTQYAALAMWQAYRAGIQPNPKMVHGLINWLLATQGEEGEWGYQGRMAKDGVPAKQSSVSQTMVAAAGASLMITADLHGLLYEGTLDSVAGTFAKDLPPGVRRVTRTEARGDTKPLPKANFDDWDRVSSSLRMAEEWMDENLNLNPERYPCYYLYSVERYQSFREARAGQIELEPAWYEKGVTWLENNQVDFSSPGVWNEQCGPTVDTAFAVLFMLRSTQKSLNTTIGEGAMVSGRGLPKNIAAAKLRRGQVIAELDVVGVGDFLSILDEGQADRLDALANDPSSLLVGDLNKADAQRLEQTLRTGEPKERLLAATALGRAGELDHVPALLYGLTDPDSGVAIAARDGLRFIARRPSGFGMQDDFNDDQRYLALEKWSAWYLRLRPEATIDLGR